MTSLSIVKKKCPLRLVLDEPVAYLGNISGTILVRGDVIVNLPKDTPIQGPIELIFEGIQRYYPWSGENDSPSVLLLSSLTSHVYRNHAKSTHWEAHRNQAPCD